MKIRYTFEDIQLLIQDDLKHVLNMDVSDNATFHWIDKDGCMEVDLNPDISFSSESRAPGLQDVGEP